jgi:hypothetical protein
LFIEDKSCRPKPDKSPRPSIEGFKERRAEGDFGWRRLTRLPMPGIVPG